MLFNFNNLLFMPIFLACVMAQTHQYHPLGIKPISRGMTPIVGSCLAFKEHFANVAQNVTHCYMYNSRPFRVCTLCLMEKIEFDAVYKNLTDRTILDEAGQPCETTLFYKDRIQVILVTKQYADEVWGDAYCDQCYNKNKSLTTDVETFLSKLNNTMQCLENYTSMSLNRNDDLELSWKNASFNSSACENCRHLYEDLNTYFESMDRTSKRQVCMDVVDRINVTRRLWSDSFNCYHFQPAWWWACWPLFFTLVSTILFYSLAVLCCKTTLTTAVYRQKRLQPGLSGSTSTVVGSLHDHY